MRFNGLLSIALLSLALLSGCGNGNDGSPLGLRKKSSGSSVNPVQVGVTPPLKLQYCKAFTVYSGTNPAFAETMAGSSICKVDSAAPVVHLKVGMSFPKSGRFCLIPMNEFAFAETCFSATDAMTYHLDPAATSYGSIVLLAEADLATYKAFLNFQTLNGPPRAFAIMNH